MRTIVRRLCKLYWLMYLAVVFYKFYCYFHIQKGVFMTLFKFNGKRIRASDKNLVYRFSASMLLFLFVVILLLLNIGQLMRTSWEHFSLIDNGMKLSTYNFITIFYSDFCLCISRFSLLPLLP